MFRRNCKKKRIGILGDKRSTYVNYSPADFSSTRRKYLMFKVETGSRKYIFQFPTKFTIIETDSFLNIHI